MYLNNPMFSIIASLILLSIAIVMLAVIWSSAAQRIAKKLMMRFDILSITLIIVALLTIVATSYSIHKDVKSQETIRQNGHTIIQQSMTWGIGVGNWGINRINVTTIRR